MPGILLIDDTEEELRNFEDILREALGAAGTVATWIPTESEEPPEVIFDRHVTAETRLVVTDHDLGTRGQTGLLGSSVAAWCRKRLIPVIDFSRRLRAVTKAPDLFELRLPSVDQGPAYTAGVYRGFVSISESLARNPGLLEERSPASALAAILGERELESIFALYSVRLGPMSGALMDAVIQDGPPRDPTATRRIEILTYISGHLLLNSVLRFPGPILSSRALAAYVATPELAADVLEIVAAARYEGPFADLDSFYWTHKVDDILQDNIDQADDARTLGEVYREVLEGRVGRRLERHGCRRCLGENGGYYCPLTQRTVCEWTECSVGSSSWLPQGASVARVEKEFFDEWSPILGQ